jgi:programmed cell death 6-interacting protein
MSKEDVNKSRYGIEIARLRVAEGLAKKGLSNTRGVADSVVSDMKVKYHSRHEVPRYRI